MFKKFFPALEDIPTLSRIDAALSKLAHLTQRKQTDQLEKMKNMQNKYILERNLDLVYYDPETGLPKIVSFNSGLHFFI
jgi:hypothetical protein